MAKKIQMDGAALEKVLHLHNLLEIPEAEKLRKLDDEMALLAKNQKIDVAAKVRKYGELLAEYRQLLEKVKQKGDTTIIDEKSGNMLKTLIKAMIQQEVRAPLTDPEVPQLEAEEQQPQSLDGDGSEDEDDSTKQEDADDTTVPTPAKRPAAGIPFETPRYAPKLNTPSAVHRRINSLLRKNGVSFDSSKVHFPLTSSRKRRRKATTASYTMSSFDKVMKFLTATSSGQKGPGSNLTQLVDLIANTALPKLNRNELQKYPNLAKVYDEKVPRLSGQWSSL